MNLHRYKVKKGKKERQVKVAVYKIYEEGR